MLALQENDAHENEERKLFSTLIELLSYEKIIFNGMFFLSLQKSAPWYLLNL